MIMFWKPIKLYLITVRGSPLAVEMAHSKLQFKYFKTHLTTIT
jgi:hypothetical protein